MISEWLEKNRKDIDILTSFLVTVIPIVMLYSESWGIGENTVVYCILMILLGIASHYASRIRGEGDVEYVKRKAKTVLGYPRRISFFGGYCYHEQNKKEDTHMQLYQNNFKCCFNSSSYQHYHDQCNKVCFN